MPEVAGAISPESNDWRIRPHVDKSYLTDCLRVLATESNNMLSARQKDMEQRKVSSPTEPQFD